MLRVELFLQKLRLCLMLLRKLGNTLADPHIVEHHLRRWIDDKLLDTFHRTLAFHVKAPDTVDIISPQLNTIRALFRQGEDVDDSSSDRKLPRCLYD